MTLRDIPTIRQRLAKGALLAAAATTALSASFAATPPAPAPGHPLAAAWNWTLFDGKCAETLHYRSDGTVVESSGESISEWTYETTPNASEKGFYKVVAHAVRTNGKKDCYGDVAGQSGMANTRYIQFNPARDRILVCKSESLQACFGPLKKE